MSDHSTLSIGAGHDGVAEQRLDVAQGAARAMGSRSRRPVVLDGQPPAAPSGPGPRIGRPASGAGRGPRREQA